MTKINKQTIPCTVPGCPKLQKSRGWCSMHLRRWETHRDLSKGMPPKKSGVIDCEIDGCSKPYFARGWCHTHYSRWRNHGTPHAEVLTMGACRDYLENIVLKHTEDACLTWPFARNAVGYGVINNADGSNIVSRIVCERVKGPSPSPAHESRHLCGKGHEGCCAPAHVEWGTPHQNQMDKVEHGTDIRGERHPLHKLTEAQAREILRLKGIVRQTTLAEKFGVKRATISHVQNRTTWAWL